MLRLLAALVLSVIGSAKLCTGASLASLHPSLHSALPFKGNNGRRSLQTLDEQCTAITAQAPGGLQTSCQCSGTAEAVSYSCSDPCESCSGDVCGIFSETGEFLSGAADSSKVCLQYTASFNDLLCIEVAYSTGGVPEGCTMSVNGEGCNSCGICAAQDNGHFSFDCTNTNTPMLSIDCSIAEADYTNEYHLFIFGGVQGSCKPSAAQMNPAGRVASAAGFATIVLLLLV